MSQKRDDQKDVTKKSMIELANSILSEQKKEMDFMALFKEVAHLKVFTEGDKDRYLSQFYTDLNLDGRFITLGSNTWALKHWYPLSKTSEQAIVDFRKKELHSLEGDYDGEMEELSIEEALNYDDE